MKATILDADSALAELPIPPRELPCGCRVPFVRCAVADDLLDAEWRAGDDMVRLGQQPGVLPQEYAAARTRWQAARRAYDAHIRGY